jgi:hypothetical protein
LDVFGVIEEDVGLLEDLLTAISIEIGFGTEFDGDLYVFFDARGD